MDIWSAPSLGAQRSLAGWPACRLPREETPHAKAHRCDGVCGILDDSVCGAKGRLGLVTSQQGDRSRRDLNSD